jgi:hypothetical protein
MQKLEIVTGHLSVPQLRQCVPEVGRFFEAAGFSKVSVVYGWGCNLPPDRQWEATEIAPGELEQFADRSEQAGIVQLGKSDLIIQDPDKTAILKLCHESDMHFVSADPAVLDQVIAWWRGKGFSLSQSLYSMVGPRDWKTVD